MMDPSSSRRCRSVRPGFTLFELLVAIVLTGVVALLAYGTAAAGFESRDRLDTYRSTVEARMIVRSLIVDALRHPPVTGGTAMNDTLFLLVDRSDAGGMPEDEIAFFTHGISPPFGATPRWLVSMTLAGDGLDVLASPLDTTATSRLVAHLPGIRGLNVRVLDRTASEAWAGQWDAPGRVPAAVAIEMFSERGLPAGPPIVVHSALDVVR